MAQMQVDVVTPERSLYSGEAEAVFARSQLGEIGILPGHQPVLLALKNDSTLRVQHPGGEQESFQLAGGFLEFRDNHLSVLADGLVA